MCETLRETQGRLQALESWVSPGAIKVTVSRVGSFSVPAGPGLGAGADTADLGRQDRTVRNPPKGAANGGGQSLT